MGQAAGGKAPSSWQQILWQPAQAHLQPTGFGGGNKGQGRWLCSVASLQPCPKGVVVHVCVCALNETKCRQVYASSAARPACWALQGPAHAAPR